MTAPTYTLPQGMMPNSLYIVPKHPPPELLGAYTSTAEPIKKAPPAAANTQIALPSGATATQEEQGEMFQTSLSGRVPNGLADARGFINTESSTQASQRQTLDEDSLDQWNRAREELAEINRRRKEIATAPLQTDPPDQWTSTTHSTHVDLLPFVERDVGRLVYRDPQARSKTAGNARPPSAQQFGLSGTQLDPRAVSFKSPPGSAASSFGAGAGSTRYDLDGLRGMLRDEQLANVTVSRNGTVAKLSGACINPDTNTLRGTHVGGREKLTSTYSAAHGRTDPMFFDGSTDAQWTLKELDMTPEEREFLERAKARAAQRHDGEYATTHAETFTDKTAQVEVTPEYRKSHHLNVSTSVRHVRSGIQVRAGNTQSTTNPTEIVPGHFTTTKMLQDSYFRGYS